VSEDALLKNEQFKELRTKLLGEAARFYEGLEKLLAGQTDAKSRKTLATAYFQLAGLTDTIGDRSEALANHRKALALRRELAAAEGADVETRLDVARSLGKVSFLLMYLGDNEGALVAGEEQRDLAGRLEADHPSDAVQFVLAHSHFRIGASHFYLGKPAEALRAFQKSLAIQQKLAGDNPTVAGYQIELAACHDALGGMLMETGKPEEARASHRKALAICQKLADDNPTVTEYQFELAGNYQNMGWTLLRMGKPLESAEASRKAVAGFKKLVADNPANTRCQAKLASSQNNVGRVLCQTGKLEEAKELHLNALASSRKLVEANPTVTDFQSTLAESHAQLGRVLARQKRSSEALIHIDAGLAIVLKLSEAEPKNTEYATFLADCHACRGWALVRSGQPSKAAADLRRAVELLGKVTVPDAQARFERSRVLALLAGLGGDAKSGVTTAEAAQFADQAVAALAAVVETGWALPSELREPDFDAVRGRADFQKLFAEVESKAEKVPETAPPPREKK
jgi:tetratricopeptide (TPR) repeat protein